MCWRRFVMLVLPLMLSGGVFAGAAIAREVSAGPIWNNEDARRKCPQACGLAGWDGNWRTTEWGRNSVCSCRDGGWGHDRGWGRDHGYAPPPQPDVCRGGRSCMMPFSGRDQAFCRAYVEGRSCFMAFSHGRDRGWCEHLREGRSCFMALSGRDRADCEAGRYPPEHLHWRRLCSRRW
ncbi:hypothetical protein ACFFJB_14360 [Camelimonas abortus]|uniref:Uncharacterized protein n=1 Tax=Camelimonas abortus TaxID=1017184 RepID=A0ABV7LFJ1_9HYPH